MKDDTDDDDISMICEDQKPPLNIIFPNGFSGDGSTTVSASALGLSQRRAPPCFLCGSEEARLHHQRQSSTTLIKELGICLEQFLEFPKNTLQEYMKRCGPLENWVPLCNDCRRLTKEGRELKEQVESLEKRMSDHQQLIVKKVKCSRVNFSNNASSSGNDNAEESLRNLDSMRKYVKAKKYPPDKYKMVAIKTIVKKIVKLLPTKKPPMPTTTRKKSTKTSSVSQKVGRKRKPGGSGGMVAAKDLKPPPPPPHSPFGGQDDDAGGDPNDDLEEDPLDQKTEVGEGQGDSKTFLCGLCIDDDCSVYESERLLIVHQKKVHGFKKSPVRRKQKQQQQQQRKRKRSAVVAATAATKPETKNKNADNESLKVEPNPEEEEGFVPVPKKKIKLTKHKADRPYVHYRYSCPNCPKVKGYWLNRYCQHLAIHQRRPYRCSECLEFLPNEEDLQEQHWKDKHGDKEIPSGFEKFVKIKMDPGKIYKCYGCYIGFSSEEERNEHEHDCYKITEEKRLKFGKENPMTCITCSEKFRDLNDFRLHRILEHPEVDSVSCFMCDKSFSAAVVGGGDGVVARDDFKFLEHLRIDHPIRERCDTRFYEECEECGVVLNGGEQKPTKKNHILKEHGGILNEKDIYPCKYCPPGKSFCNAPALRLHVAKDHFLHSIDTATGCLSAPSLCDNCGKDFKSKWSLYHHNYTQHGVIPEGAQIINCPKEGCQFKSVVRGSVTDHHQKAHVLHDTRPYKCEYCPKDYKNSVELRRHHATHENNGGKPLQCDQCGTRFANKKNLRQHIKHIHDKKPYPPSYRKKRPPRRKKANN